MALIKAQLAHLWREQDCTCDGWEKPRKEVSCRVLQRVEIMGLYIGGGGVTDFGRRPDWVLGGSHRILDVGTSFWIGTRAFEDGTGDRWGRRGRKSDAPRGEIGGRNPASECMATVDNESKRCFSFAIAMEF